MAARSATAQGTFLKKDDPKVTALMQQAELLSSLAFQVNAESTDQSFENAWKLLQEYLNHKKEGHIASSDAYFQQDFREMVVDFVKSDMESQTSWRQPYLQDESPTSSEYSSGSVVLPCSANDQNGKTRVSDDRKYEYLAAEVSSHHSKEGRATNECGIFASAVTEMIESSDAPLNVDDLLSASQQTEFGSPIKVTPLFRSVGAGIPSPKFSESERSFLMRTLGMESTLSSLNIDPSNPPPCKRALLQSL